MDALRVLLVEDDAAFTRLIERLLAGVSPALALTPAVTMQQAVDLAMREAFDAALLDLQLPDSAGLDSVTRLCGAAPGLPVVVLTGSADESLSAAALQAGAQDYLPKGDLEPAVLVRILRHAVERQRASAELRQKDEQFRALFETAPLGILTVDRAGTVRAWNAEATRIFGWDAEEVVGRPMPPVTAVDEALVKAQLAALLRGERLPSEEGMALRKDGTDIDVTMSAAPLFDAHGQVTGAAFMLKDISRRRHAERVLRESERRYRLMFEHNPNPMWVFDAETFAFLAVNDAAVESYGYSRDEFLRMTILDIRPAEDVPGVVEAVRSRPGSSGELEARHIRRDGSLRYVRVSGHPIEFASRPARLALVADVTETRLAEARQRFLTEASGVLNPTDLNATLEQVSRLAVESVADICAVLLVSGEGQVEELRVTHGDPDVQSRLQSLVLDGAAIRGDRPAPGYEQVLSTRRPVLQAVVEPDRFRAFARNPEMASRLAALGLRSAAHLPLESGGRVFGVISFGSARPDRRYDAADLALFEDLARRLALTIDNARLVREARELFDADLTCNFVAARDGTLHACNAAFAELFGYPSVEAARGAVAASLFGDGSEWHEFVQLLERERGLEQRELTLRTLGGAAVHVLISASVLLDATGRLLQLRGQLYDLTQHKQLEEQFGHSQKLEAVGRLAGGIAHDFNNLLMVITGQAERLLQQLPGTPNGHEAARAIQLAADRAAGLTQQLLAFSRRQVLSLQPLDVNGVMRGLYNMLERVIGEDVTCTLRLTEGLDTIVADPGRLEQALLNLAVNARDAMPGGGSLTLATEAVELDETYSRQHINAKPGRYVLISVSDTGTGMDAETRARVFEPFFTTKPQGKGTGLGLSMVYGIIKQIGGYIWVYSEPGYGTTFKIYLPSVNEPARPVATGTAAAPAMAGGETVLLVEDEDGVRELLEELLKGLGYRVYVASRATEALQISEFLDEDLDLLITDVVMPQMGGRELAARLLARRPGVRVLYLSGYSNEAVHQHGIVDPGAAFLQKPFTRAALSHKVREVLGTSTAP